MANEYLIQKETLTTIADKLRQHLGTLQYQFISTVELGLLKTSQVEKLFYETIDVGCPDDGKGPQNYQELGFFTATGYDLNNENRLVPVLYEYVNQFFDRYYYIGRTTILGTEVDKWRKIEYITPGESENWCTWESAAKEYAYTAPVVEKADITKINLADFATKIEEVYTAGKAAGSLAPTRYWYLFNDAFNSSDYFNYIVANGNASTGGHSLTFKIKFRSFGDAAITQHNQMTFDNYPSGSREIFFDNTFVGSGENGALQYPASGFVELQEEPSTELTAFLNKFAVPCEAWIFRDNINMADWEDYFDHHGVSNGYDALVVGANGNILLPNGVGSLDDTLYTFSHIEFGISSTRSYYDLLQADYQDLITGIGSGYLANTAIVFRTKPSSTLCHFLQTFAIQKLSSESGIQLPSLTTPAAETDVVSGKEFIKEDGTVGTGTIVTKTSADLSASGRTVTVPAGYYATNATKSISTATQATPSVSVSSTGLITASATQSAGYVSAGTKSGTKQLTTQAAKTITPGTTAQTAVAKDVYTTGAVTVAGDSDLVSGNIKKDVTIFGVTGTYEGTAGVDLDQVRVVPESLGINPSAPTRGMYLDYKLTDGTNETTAMFAVLTSAVTDPIVPEVIKNGTTILGVTGTCPAVAPTTTITIYFSGEVFAGIIHVWYTGSDGRYASQSIEYNGSASQTLTINAVQNTPVWIKPAVTSAVVLQVVSSDQTATVVDTDRYGVATDSAVCFYSADQYARVNCMILAGANDLEALDALCDWEISNSQSGSSINIVNYHPTFYLLADLEFGYQTNGVVETSQTMEICLGAGESHGYQLFQHAMSEGYFAQLTNIRWSATDA